MNIAHNQEKDKFQATLILKVDNDEQTVLQIKARSMVTLITKLAMAERYHRKLGLIN